MTGTFLEKMNMTFLEKIYAAEVELARLQERCERKRSYYLGAHKMTKERMIEVINLIGDHYDSEEILDELVSELVAAAEANKDTLFDYILYTITSK